MDDINLYKLYNKLKYEEYHMRKSLGMFVTIYIGVTRPFLYRITALFIDTYQLHATLCDTLFGYPVKYLEGDTEECFLMYEVKTDEGIE